jgi:hypothetical protein
MSEVEHTTRPEHSIRGRKRHSEDHQDGHARAQHPQFSIDEDASGVMSRPVMGSERGSQTQVTQLTRDVLMSNANGSQSRRGNGTPMTGAGKLQHVRSVDARSNPLVTLSALFCSLQVPLERLQSMLQANKDEHIRILQKLLEQDEDVDRDLIQMQSYVRSIC